MEDGEIKTEKQLYDYLDKIKELSEEELCIEIYNIFQAKAKLREDPYWRLFGKYQGLSGMRLQSALKDLNDRILGIVMTIIGKEGILSYGSPEILMGLLNELDQALSMLNLSPTEYGKMFLQTIRKNN